MSAPERPRDSGERGMALVSSMLLLAVVTILALGMFRSFGVQEQIAGNLREKQRALHAAESAQQYAEWWLSRGNNAATVARHLQQRAQCQPEPGPDLFEQAHERHEPAIAGGGVDAGVTYNPGNAMTVTTTSARETYYKVPRFYIADIGQSADATGEIYQINAVG